MGGYCSICKRYENPEERVPLMTTKSNTNSLFITEKGSLVDKVVQKAADDDSLNIDPVIKEIIDHMSSDDAQDAFDEEKYKTILQNIED